MAGELIGAIVNYSIREFDEILFRLRHADYTACVEGGKRVSGLRSLLGFQKRSSGETALHVACRLCRVSFAEQLVYSDAPVDVRDDRGNTPLHIAAEYGLETVVIAITCVGGDISMVNRHGLTAQQIADRCGGTGIRIAQWLEVVEKRRLISRLARLPAFPLKACVYSHDKWASMGTFSEEIERLIQGLQKKECVALPSDGVMKSARNERTPSKNLLDLALMRD